MNPVVESGCYLNINTATGTLVHTGPCRLLGVFCASGSSPTIKIWDQTTAATPVAVNTFTPALGWTSMPFTLNTALFVTTGGTIDCTIAWIPS